MIIVIAQSDLWACSINYSVRNNFQIATVHGQEYLGNGSKYLEWDTTHQKYSNQVHFMIKLNGMDEYASKDVDEEPYSESREDILIDLILRLLKKDPQ